jgi:hypothetical protein
MWPPQSLDLSPLDFYLFLKKKVYKNNAHILEELKQNPKLCISYATAETLHWIASNMRKRVNICTAEHFQHLT